jgi:hypothetical protein
MNIDLEPLFDNKLPYFITFGNPFFLCKVVKTTFNITTSSMEKHFITSSWNWSKYEKINY